MTIKVIASVGLALILVAPAVTGAEAKHQLPNEPVFFDRAVGGYTAVEFKIASPRNSRAKRKLHQRRYKDGPHIAAKPAPKPGTLNAYRNEIAKDSISDPVAALSSKALGNIQGLKTDFIAKLSALRDGMPAGMGFRVGSGFRSHAEQARLHALKPRLAARPGTSKHERGLAGDLKFASAESAQWVHRNSRKYGLTFPMSYEPWHIEPIGVTRFAKRHHRYAAAQ